MIKQNKLLSTSSHWHTHVWPSHFWLLPSALDSACSSSPRQCSTVAKACTPCAMPGHDFSFPGCAGSSQQLIKPPCHAGLWCSSIFPRVCTLPTYTQHSWHCYSVTNSPSFWETTNINTVKPTLGNLGLQLKKGGGPLPKLCAYPRTYIPYVLYTVSYFCGRIINYFLLMKQPGFVASRSHPCIPQKGKEFSVRHLTPCNITAFTYDKSSSA